MSTRAQFAGPQRVGQIALPVKDLDRAVAFYGETLGLRFLFRAPPGLAFFDCGGGRLMLSLPEGPGEASTGGIVYYVVPDLSAAHAALTARGMAFLDPPHPDCAAARPRALDGDLPGLGGQHARTDERGPVAERRSDEAPERRASLAAGGGGGQP